MEEIYPDWKRLPVEILHIIFQIVIAEHSWCEAYTFTVVCKSWLLASQVVMYSNVGIKTPSQLRKFHDTVKHNNRLGNTVKVFGLCYWFYDAWQSNDEEVSNISSSLLHNCLPNLQELKDGGLGPYRLVLECLKNSKLKQLKKLNMPSLQQEDAENEIQNYVTCVLMLKDRIENILISETLDSNSQSSVFDRLYNILHQFKNLSILDIYKKTDDEIWNLEYILEACKFLNEISFNFIPLHGLESNERIPTDAVLNFTARPNIISLDCTINISSNCKILLYIMNTFSNLQKLSLIIKNDSIPLVMDLVMLNNLLQYLSKIKEYNVHDLIVHRNNITEIIESFWKLKPRHRNEQVLLYFKKITSREAHSSLQLIRSKHASITQLVLAHFDLDWVQSNFLMRNGKSIGHLLLSDNLLSETNYKLPANFIPNIITHCIELKELYFQHFTFKQFAPYHSRINFSKRLSLNVLSFLRCVLYAGMMDQLSLLVAEVKLLCLGSITYKSSKNGNLDVDRIVEIIMPYSKIDKISLVGESVPLFVRVFVVGHEHQYYYQYDHLRNTGQVEESSEQQYIESNNHKQVYVCCQTKPTFHISM